MKKCGDILLELSNHKKKVIAENAKNYPILTAVLSNCLWSGIHIFGFDGLSVILGQISAQDAETALNFAYAGYAQPKPADMQKPAEKPAEKAAEKPAEKAAEAEAPKPAEKPAPAPAVVPAASKSAEQSTQKAGGRPRKNPAPAAVPAENADFDAMSSAELRDFCIANSCYHKVMQDMGDRKAGSMRAWLKLHFVQKSAEAEAKPVETPKAAEKPAEKEAEKPAEQPKPAEVQTAEADPYKGLDAKALYVLCLQRKIDAKPRQDAAAYRALLEADDAEIEAAAKEEEKAEAEAQEATEAAPAEQVSYEPDAVPVPSEGEDFDDWDLADDDPTKAAEPAPAEAAEDDDDDDWDL